MKRIAILTAAALASAAFAAVAAEGHGDMAQRLKAADTNGDGMISKEEAKALPRLLKHFDEIDANRDGQITKEEMHAFHAAHEGGKGHHGGFMKKLDKDGDGRISREEAQAAPRLAAHFEEIDTNKDGFITPDEMKAAHARREGK
jgi:Ca2+-binding EF-hand superfamily protein